MSFQQVSDTIYINDVSLELHSYPLDDYLNQFTPSRKFDALNSACWRGYFTTWKLISQELFLVELEANMKGFKMGLEAFMGTPNQIKADWYTGQLIIPVSTVIYNSENTTKYPDEIRIEVFQGNVSKIFQRFNEIDETTYRILSFFELEISAIELYENVRLYKRSLGDSDPEIFFMPDDGDLPF